MAEAMSDVTDVVKALSELATELRAMARDAEVGRADAYHEAAAMVGAVMIGPAIQAALDQLDAETDAASDVTVIDQTAAAKLVGQLTDTDRVIQ